jgi:hypothetical protein
MKKIFIIVVLLFPLFGQSQSIQDIYVQKANEVKNMVQEGLDRTEAHIKDMGEIGTTVWKAAYEEIFDAKYDCINSKKSYEIKNIYPFISQLEKIIIGYEDEFSLYKNSVNRLEDMFKSSKERACYAGYEHNINGYIDCQMKTYHYLVVLNQSIGISTMQRQFGILKKQANEYISCTKVRKELTIDGVNVVADKLTKSGEFYKDTIKRFSRAADNVKN